MDFGLNSLQRLICHKPKQQNNQIRYEYITLFILLGVKATVVWERQTDGRRRIQTAISSHNISWPYRTVLSSRPHLVLLLRIGRGLLNIGPTVGHSVLSSRPYIFYPDETYSTGLHLGVAWLPAATFLYLPTRLTAASWYWQTASLSRGHLHISFGYTQPFPIDHVTASAYFHICVLWRESLIDGSVKGQYATTTNIGKAWTAIDRLTTIWESDISTRIKREFFAAVSVLLYSCTT